MKICLERMKEEQGKLNTVTFKQFFQGILLAKHRAITGEGKGVKIRLSFVFFKGRNDAKRRGEQL